MPLIADEISSPLVPTGGHSLSDPPEPGGGVLGAKKTRPLSAPGKRRCFKSLDYADDSASLWTPLLASMALHTVGFFFLMHLTVVWRRPATKPVELDLSGPYEVVPAGLTLRPRPVRKGTPDGKPGLPKLPTVTATPKSASPESTVATGTLDDEGSRRGGADGLPEGAEFNFIALTARPRLLNGRELADTMRRFYPEAERRAGREAAVTLDLHVSAGGEVARAEVVRSGGDAFDRAALRVASFFRFSPARVGDKAVAVKLCQTIHFQLRG